MHAQLASYPKKLTKGLKKKWCQNGEWLHLVSKWYCIHSFIQMGALIGISTKVHVHFLNKTPNASSKNHLSHFPLHTHILLMHHLHLACISAWNCNHAKFGCLNRIPATVVYIAPQTTCRACITFISNPHFAKRSPRTNFKSNLGIGLTTWIDINKEIGFFCTAKDEPVQTNTDINVTVWNHALLTDLFGYASLKHTCLHAYIGVGVVHQGVHMPAPNTNPNCHQLPICYWPHSSRLNPEDLLCEIAI